MAVLAIDDDQYSIAGEFWPAAGPFDQTPEKPRESTNRVLRSPSLVCPSRPAAGSGVIGQVSSSCTTQWPSDDGHDGDYRLKAPEAAPPAGSNGRVPRWQIFPLHVHRLGRGVILTMARWGPWFGRLMPHAGEWRGPLLGLWAVCFMDPSQFRAKMTLGE